MQYVVASLILGVSLILSVVVWQELAEANHTAELTNCMAHVQLIDKGAKAESDYLTVCVAHQR